MLVLLCFIMSTVILDEVFKRVFLSPTKSGHSRVSNGEQIQYQNHNCLLDLANRENIA